MLKEHNILMRDCSGKGGFDNKQYMRIAVRDHDDNARLIESLRMIGEGL
jgi:histidinol-phosphate/aromatic aminotransferase/cobyric acid decarboxylase-like protein